MAENQIFTGRTAGQHAVAAFEAIAGYARERLRPWTADSGLGGRDPAQDHDRLSGMLCALRHLTDKYAEISFRSVLDDSTYEFRRQRADPHRTLPAGAAAAARAIDTCHRSISTPAQYRDSAWPPDALAGLRAYAAWAGQGFPAAIASITGQLITDLWHYADRQHIDFATAMTAADQAYASQRLAAEGPFQTGLDPGQHPASALAPSPVATASGLIATRQGMVTSFADAEWLLVRTAARIDYQARNAPASPCQPDEDDLVALSRALGGMCGQSAEQIVRQLTPQIESRITEIEQGPDTAAELGREHGQAGTEPYCDLDLDGDATALMHALGETEPMTGANYPYRLNLVTAYAQAYRQASTHGPATAASPARIAAESFPHPDRPATPAGPAAPGPAAHRAQARPGSRPRHGPTR